MYIICKYKPWYEHCISKDTFYSGAKDRTGRCACMSIGQEIWKQKKTKNQLRDKSLRDTKEKWIAQAGKSTVLFSTDSWRFISISWIRYAAKVRFYPSFVIQLLTSMNILFGRWEGGGGIFRCDPFSLSLLLSSCDKMVTFMLYRLDVSTA